MTEPTLEFAIAERDKCLAYLDGDGPDKWLAWLGWRDWTVEIRLLTMTAPAIAYGRRIAAGIAAHGWEEREGVKE